MLPPSHSPSCMASLSKGHTDRMNSDELRELTASSAVEVQRVCTLFSCLQQLVMAESIKPQLSPTLILPLLAYAVEGVNLVFQQNGIALSSVAARYLSACAHQSRPNLAGSIQGATGCPWAVRRSGHDRAHCLLVRQGSCKS